MPPRAAAAGTVARMASECLAPAHTPITSASTTPVTRRSLSTSTVHRAYAARVSDHPDGLPIAPTGHVPGGVLHYRRRLHALGPFAALPIPGLLGLFAWLALRDNSTLWRAVLGLVLAVAAAPGLLAVGGPLAESVGLQVAGVAASVGLWCFVGRRAARRATRRGAADWSDYRRELWWGVAAVWCGCVLSLVVFVLLLGQPAV